MPESHPVPKISCPPNGELSGASALACEIIGPAVGGWPSDVEGSATASRPSNREALGFLGSECPPVGDYEWGLRVRGYE